MADPISTLQAAGFDEKQIGAWAAEKRNTLSAAGFADNEIDAYMVGGVTVPDYVPDALDRRAASGKVTWGDVGRSALNDIKNAITSIPYIPQQAGEASERFRINEGTAEDAGTVAGAAAAFGGLRLSKLTRTGQTAGMLHTPSGEPIGSLPESQDFAAASKVLAGDGRMPVQEKLLKVWEDNGVHPAEAARAAETDPVVAQRLLSSDKADMPPPDAIGGVPPEPPRPPVEPKGGEPPEAPPPESFEAAQKTILDKISVGERTEPRKYTLDKLYTDTIDDLHPLKAVSTDAYELARLTRGQFGKAEQFLDHGSFDFKTYETNGKSLRSILEPVQGDLDGLRAYLASKRALEIEATGRTSGMDASAAGRVAADGEKQYGPIAAELTGYQNKLTAYLRDSGVLSDKAYDAMVEANKNYVPFYRVMGNEEGGAAGKGFGPGNPLKRLKGSERSIVDPLESVIKNTYAYVSIAERNAVGIKLVDALKAEGMKAETTRLALSAADAELVDHLKGEGVKDAESLVEFVRTASRDGETIGAYRNGVREEVAVNDPELVRAFRGLDEQSVGMLTKVFAVPARMLRAGSVLTPDFIARNLVRDFQTAFVNSKGLFSPLDTAKGVVEVFRKGEDFQSWLKSGGANSTMVALDRRYMQESLKTLTDETGLGTRAWNVVTSPLTGLRMLSELMENATRLGEFKKALAGATDKEAIQAAGFASREVTLDFARMGARMRAYNMVTAFANAQIQGVDRIVRAFADRPVNTTLKIAGGVTLPSVLLWFANHGDERYEELPSWQKDLFWIVLTDKWEPATAAGASDRPEHLVRQRDGQFEVNNGHIWRIPKPFELGVLFGSGAERALDATIGGDKEAFDGFAKSVMQVFTPNFIPTAAQPVFEQWANRSTFTDRTLIPSDLEKQLPEYQYTPYTTQLSKKLGQVISAFPGMRDAATTPGAITGPIARTATSPILIENYVRAWTGGLGMYALNAADAGLRKAGVLPDPVTPTPTLADIPFVKAFAVRYPSASTESIQKFYDDYERNKRFLDTYNAKAKEGDADALDRIGKAGGPLMFTRLDAIKDTLSEHSKMVRDIYKSPDIPADEKRQLIDGLYYRMIEMGQAGRQMMREAAKASEPTPGPPLDHGAHSTWRDDNAP